MNHVDKSVIIARIDPLGKDLALCRDIKFYEKTSDPGD